ncbi:MAG TPA: type II toxin-antitoxin system HicA family toxin [Verrucomicrobiae bacterium]|nr:type II toxin-antitoxin system HicA family toxin [Verrucomicrobiae bacterium]
MSKIKVLSGKEVCRILGENGFVKVRQRGSHIVMQKRLPSTTITVPVPNHRELDRGTLRGIIRQSQLERELFEAD